MTEEVRAQVGRPFEVELACAPTTGYTWELQPLPPGLRLRARRFEQAPHAAPGDGGVAVFELEAAEPGSYTLQFEYKRRWETQVERRQMLKLLVL